MKIFITGGSSYLGRHVVPFFHSRGHEVCHTWFSTPPSIDFPGQAIQVDMRDNEQLTEAIIGFQPNAIIHLAASNRSPTEDEMVDSIISGAMAVTDIAKSLSCRLIHMSTDVVFDGSQSLYNEETPVAPPHAYGRAKVEAERLVGNYSNSVIIRPSLIYSLRIKDRGIEWVEAALNEGKEVTLFTDQMRMPVWTETLAAACLELIDHSHCGLIHIVGNQRLSRAEFGQKMLDWWGIYNRETLRYAPTPPNVPWPQDLTMDTELANRILTTPLLGVDEVISKSIRG
ncbi:MAG: NAD(P)-dependent oxidoreductase [Anaerolineae bacterium]